MVNDDAASPPSTTPTFSIQAALSQMGPEARQQCEYHLNELQACLAQTSPYAVRDDSRLAFRYASGQAPPHWTPWIVAHEMACTQYLCDTLPYQPTQQQFLRELASTLKREVGVDWKRVWAAVAELGPEILKLHMMGESGVMMPDFAPAHAVS